MLMNLKLSEDLYNHLKIVWSKELPYILDAILCVNLIDAIGCLSYSPNTHTHTLIIYIFHIFSVIYLLLSLYCTQKSFSMFSLVVCHHLDKMLCWGYFGWNSSIKVIILFLRIPKLPKLVCIYIF